MNHLITRRSSLVILVFSLICNSAISRTIQDKKAIVKKAAAAYYSLKNQGLDGFECNAVPDWNKFFADNFKDTPPPSDDIIKKIKPLQAKITVSMAQAPNVTLYAPNGSELDDASSEIADILPPQITSFYQTWWPFAFAIPFTDFESDFDLKEVGNNYQLSQKQGATEITIVMGKDFVISEEDIVLQGNSIIFRPKYKQTSEGLLLTSIESDTKSPQQHVIIDVEYQDVNGIKVPSKVSYKTTVPGRDITINVAFDKYKLIKS